MPLVRITRSIEISSTREKVFAAINDLNAYEKWSPWLLLEPECKNTIKENGKFNEWEGRRSGSGNMRITETKEGEFVNLDLQFIKPMKTSSKLHFELSGEDGAIIVSWTMENKLPFFLFFMKKMMEMYVGMDFERGLRLMKDYIEDGEIHSKLNFIGNETFNGCSYVGIRTECTKETMGKKMAEDLPKIMKMIEEKGLTMSGDVFTQYLKWDMKRDRIEYISGVGVESLPAETATGFISGNIPITSVYTLEHVGPYHHLGNAWSAMYSMQRSKDFKVNKAVPPFETYHNKPGDVPDNELITRIHFPTK